MPASNGGKKFYPLQTGSLCPCEATAALASLTSGRSEPDLAPSLLPLPAACCADARFAVDSPLEENGFEPSVPPQKTAFFRSAEVLGSLDRLAAVRTALA